MTIIITKDQIEPNGYGGGNCYGCWFQFKEYCDHLYGYCVECKQYFKADDESPALEEVDYQKDKSAIPQGLCYDCLMREGIA